MGKPSDLNPVRNKGELWTMTCVFDVGASGAHALKYGKGMSVAKSATGKYTVTFTDVDGILVDLEVRYHSAADAESLVPRCTVDSFSRSAKTAAFEVWEIDETAAQVEPASGTDCVIVATFTNL